MNLLLAILVNKQLIEKVRDSPQFREVTLKRKRILNFRKHFDLIQKNVQVVRKGDGYLLFGLQDILGVCSS